MNEIIERLSSSSSWDEICNRFGEYLGLENRILPEIVMRALEDDIFAHYLIVCRNRPDYLQTLLDDPENHRYHKKSEDYFGNSGVASNKVHSNLDLIRKASRSLVRWAGSGFERVEPDKFQKRMDICGNCEYLTEPPEKLLYKFKLKSESDLRICDKCGCVASRKARLSTESCPAEHPVMSGLTKWEEPVKEKH